MRFLSILLLLAGLVLAGYGGAQWLEKQHRAQEPAEMAIASAPAADEAMEAAPAPAAAEDATEDAGMAMEEEGLPEIGDSAAAADDDMMAETAAAPLARSLPAPSLDEEPMFTGEGAPIAPMSRSLGAEEESLAGIEVAPDVMAAAPPAADPAEAFLSTLKTVPVAHETPATAEYKRPFEAVLAIDATGDDTAVDALPGRGNIEEGTAKVSKKVEARLSGSGFAIKAMTPEQQTISPLTENTWRWQVTPLTAGNQELTFDIYAIDDGPAVPLRTFHNTVTVQVTGLNRAIAFADQANPLAVFLGGVGSILAGLFGAIKFVRKR